MWHTEPVFVANMYVATTHEDRVQRDTFHDFYIDMGIWKITTLSKLTTNIFDKQLHSRCFKINTYIETENHSAFSKKFIKFSSMF